MELSVREPIMRKVLHLVFALTCTLAVGACDGPEQAQAKRKAEEQSVRTEAERKAEQELFRDVDSAQTVIKERIDRFVWARGETLIVRETRRSNPDVVVGLHVLPLSTSWRVHCERGRLQVSIGPYDNEGEIIPPLRLARVRLADDVCRQLAMDAGRIMAGIVRK